MSGGLGLPRRRKLAQQSRNLCAFNSRPHVVKESTNIFRSPGGAGTRVFGLIRNPLYARASDDGRGHPE